MKRKLLPALTGVLALAATALAQSTSAGYAPANFGNMIVTSMPSNATGSSGVSTIYSSAGTEFTFGTGGALVNPAEFNYTVTGPNTATLSTPASGSTPASTTELVFTGPKAGTYTTVAGESTTTGSFNLSAIPSSAPIANVSTRTTVPPGGSSTVGFVIAGTMPRRVLIRAVGPGMTSFGVSSVLANPSLSLYQSTQLLATNDNWGTLAPNVSTGATLDASIGSTSLGVGSSSTSANNTGLGATTGTTSGTITGTTGTASGATTGGTTSTTSSTSTALTSTASTSTNSTGSGASATGGTSGFLTGTLASGSSFTTQLATAENFSSLGAFALTSGSLDSALVATLPPGAYTVVVKASTAATATTSGGASATTSSTGATSIGVATGSVGSSSASTGVTSPGTSTGDMSTGILNLGTSTSSTTPVGPASSTTGVTTAISTSGGEVLVEVYFIE